MKLDLPKLCREQETCLDYSTGEKKRGHHIRLVNCCIFWINGVCNTEAIMIHWKKKGLIGDKGACKIKQ